MNKYMQISVCQKNAKSNKKRQYTSPQILPTYV